LDQKCETGNSGYEISVNTDFQNHLLIWMGMLPWDIERFAEDLYNRFGDNIIIDVGIKYYPAYGDVLNRPEFILEIKEKLRVEKGYILTEGHNFELMSLLHLYLDIYFHSNYENDMNMVNCTLIAQLQSIGELILTIMKILGKKW
jgi:hypothetical protein